MIISIIVFIMKIRIHSSKPYSLYGLLERIRIFIINTIILIIYIYPKYYSTSLSCAKNSYGEI